MTGSRSAPGGFFTDADFDYEARIVLGAAATGIGDTGLVLATLGQITDGDPQSWFDAWTTLAAGLAARGAEALGRGHLESAGWAMLAAAEYYAKALVFVDGLADPSVLLPTFRHGRDCWEKAVDAAQGRFVRMRVPYEDTTLPGYLLRPDATGAPRPTLVVTNGSDGSLPGLLGYGAAEALSRGWNAFVFDGPGQQAMLFERGVPFRYDWEAVLTPVIDALVQRPDVDASALTGYGISQGGYWITRAVAFERRLVAAVADPGVVDVSAGWTAHLPPALLGLMDSGDKDAFNSAVAQAQAGTSPAAARRMAFRAKPYGITDPFGLFTEVRKYQVRDVAGRITTPLLILDPDDEQFFPGQPRQLYDLLPGEKEIIEFTRAQGTNHSVTVASRSTLATTAPDGPSLPCWRPRGRFARRARWPGHCGPRPGPTLGRGSPIWPRTLPGSPSSRWTAGSRIASPAMRRRCARPKRPGWCAACSPQIPTRWTKWPPN
jgi:dienelactone hydrolase